MKLMPFALVIIGLILIVSGARNTYQPLGQQLISDFTGPGNFTYWLVALGVLGAIGSIPQFKRVSHLLLALTIIAMVLKNGGLFAKVTQFLQNGPTTPTAAPNTSVAAATPTAANNNSASNAQAASAIADIGMLAIA